MTYTLPLDDPPSLTCFTETITNAALTSIPLTKKSESRAESPSPGGIKQLPLPLRLGEKH